jgi:hypothetical protein
LEALKLNNQWISDTALKSCYYLPRLSPNLNTKLKIFIDSLDIEQFIRQREELTFSFKLSNIFTELKSFCLLRSADVLGLLLLALLVLFANPILILIVAIIFSLQREFLLRYPAKLTVSEVIQTRVAIPVSILTGHVVLMQVQSFMTATNLGTLSVGIDIPYVIWIGMFLATPWYQVYAYHDDIITGMRRLKSSTTIKDVLIVIGFILLILGLFVGAVLGLSFILKLIPKSVLPYVVGALAVFTIWSYVNDNIKNFFWKIRENRRTDIYFREPRYDRASIAEHFYSLKTVEGRLYFVRILQGKNINPRGEWPDKSLPNIGNDYGSTLLAQLEEKWLGLDR